MNEITAPATGEHTTQGTPHGFTSLTPYLALQNPDGAMDFYRDVFGAEAISVLRHEGTIIHAELQFGHGRLQLGAAAEAFHLVAPDPAQDTVQYSLTLYLPDVDAVVDKAVAAGAIVREPLTTWVSGDRYASLRDPFGVRWSVRTRVEDLSDEESAERVAAWMDEMAAQS